MVIVDGDVYDADAYRLSAYDYHLPESLIAQHPVEPRDASRLMVVRGPSTPVYHGQFRELPRWLRPGDLLVVNETRVFPARLLGRRAGTGGQVELLLLESRPSPEGVWRALARPARRLRAGAVIHFAAGLVAEVVGEEAAGVRRVRFQSQRPLSEALEEAGQVPLPPYIRVPLHDPERYQTVYARERGSVAAPTAGLHFTPGLLQALRCYGVEVVPLILHVGRGTFQPVETEDVRQHRMEEETYQIPVRTAQAIAAARARGRRVVAVGTTVARALESAAVGPGQVQPGEGRTALFITPGFRFRVLQGLVTNFHLPKSTLLMLVSAFLGRRRTLALYEEAVRKGYRFYSFGDAMLILKDSARAWGHGGSKDGGATAVGKEARDQWPSPFPY